ncbi:MAG: MFS transporter [Candidatus Eiseniibacteriota bacterium]|nr:MAG: MFS transporter [Candidatus Eisenbacteria bacterium]
MQKGRAQLGNILRALAHRNFRLFFGGQSISLIGTWMQRVALGWLVYRLTDSAFLLGVIGFAGQIPTFILAPLAGVLADRWNRQRILLLTQTLAMMQALLLAVLVLTDSVEVWHLIVLSTFLGVINAFDMPTRQSFMVEMIDGKKDLGNAIALNSTMVNGARLLGPSAAGLLIVAVGEGICFLINGLSYLAVISSLLLMKIAPREVKPEKSRLWKRLKDGFGYAMGFEPISAILLMLALVSVMGMPYTVLMPVFARDFLKGGPDALGFLMGAAGVGALVGALYLASRKSVLGLGRMIPVSVSVFGLGLIAFSFSRSLLVSITLMLATGFGQMVLLAASNTLLQTMVDDDKRGRVMSFYTTSFMGLMPFGSLLAGFMASRIGAPWTVCVGGIASILGSVLFAKRLPVLRRKVLPVYVDKGIIPQIASGIQNATELSLVNRIPKK